MMRILVVLLGLVLIPSAAAAQEVATSSADLRGDQTVARPLFAASSASFDLGDRGPGLRRRSGFKPVAIGAVVGGAAGMGVGAYVMHYVCEGSCGSADSARILAVTGGMGAGVGAAVGWVVSVARGALHQPAPVAGRVTAAPLLARGARGAVVSVTF